MRSLNIDRPNVTINFVENLKETKNIFLINGYTRGHSDFKAMMKYLDDKGIGSLSCDNRGAGSSQTREAFLLEDMALDIISILDQLGIEKINFVGISMGGLILQKLIERHSERIEKLVFISSTNDPGQIKSGNHVWPDNLDDIFKKMQSYFSTRFVIHNELLIKAMAKNIYESISTGSFELGASLQSAAIRNSSFDKSQDPLHFPVLIIHGDEDRIIPTENVERLGKRFLSYESVIYEGSGHLLIAEKAKTLYQDIVDFIGRP